MWTSKYYQERNEAAGNFLDVQQTDQGGELCWRLYAPERLTRTELK